MNSILISVLVIGIPLALISAIWWLATHNRLIRLRNIVDESWRQIDVQLQRRHDLIPNLVATVKGYAAYERETLENVVAARTLATKAQGPAEATIAEQGLTRTLTRLLAITEAYPELRASQNFLYLQEELSAAENRIAAARRIYNSNVRHYNTSQQVAPASLIAKQMKLTVSDYFSMGEELNATPTEAWL